MVILETTNIILILCLCFMASKSDLKTGLIKNKLLLIFLVVGTVANIAYYGFLARDLLFEYIVNVGLVSMISLCLFYSHSLAGGDCKLTIVLSILYPARFYVVFGTTNFTLLVAVGFAIFVGFFYLVVNSLWSIITRKTEITLKYVTNSLLAFAKSYITATLYIFVINVFLRFLEMYGVAVNIWISRMVCMAMAWCVGKYSILKNKLAIFIVSIVVIVLSITFKTLPFSTNPENYSLVLILLFCQMAIRTIIYENVNVNDLKKGMILSSMSTLLMQSSITQGLPKLSTEDLRSRLSETEIESINVWAKATKTEFLVIVKKIPFAIFLSVGFISYLLLWGVLWVLK